MGWAMDGFGIYAYQDVGGAAPVVDECGGHFGPTDTGEVAYHYHSRTIVPYHLACQESNCDGFLELWTTDKTAVLVSWGVKTWQKGTLQSKITTKFTT